MKSIAIMVFMFLTLTVGAKAQENQRIFTAEEQAIVDLSNSKWEWMAEKNVEKLAELCSGRFFRRANKAAGRFPQFAHKL